MASKDIPNLGEVLIASSTFQNVSGYYPGSGPDGSAETDAPDGPFKRISPMMFSVDHRELPAYIIEAVLSAESKVAQDDPGALERALMKELEAMGVDPSEVGFALTPDSSAQQKPYEEAGNSPKTGSPDANPRGSTPSVGGSSGKGSTPSAG